MSPPGTLHHLINGFSCSFGQGPNEEECYAVYWSLMSEIYDAVADDFVPFIRTTIMPQLYFAINMFSFFSSFINDKHRCKIGEPGLPAAAVDCWKKLLFHLTKNLQLQTIITRSAHHPSAILSCKIPFAGWFILVEKVHVGCNI